MLGSTAQALATIGIDLEAVRRSVEESFGTGALAGAARAAAAGPATSRSALARSRRSSAPLREALALRDRNIGPQHILLGLYERRPTAASPQPRCAAVARTPARRARRDARRARREAA